MKKNIPMVKQIIIVTDGCSNIGVNPVEAAKRALSKGIYINTIGILDQKNQEEKPFEEVISIAEAGGGNYQYTYIDDLYQTLQSVSQKTVTNTIKEAVNEQLKKLVGNDLNEISPSSRRKLLNYIDDYSEEVDICCLILMDYSGSMTSKIVSARQSILDVLDSLKNRKGRIHFSVLAFPGNKYEICKVLLDFHEGKEDMERRLCQMKTGGGTPTAAAIDKAVEHMINYLEEFNNETIYEMEEATMG